MRARCLANQAAKVYCYVCCDVVGSPVASDMVMLTFKAAIRYSIVSYTAFTDKWSYRVLTHLADIVL